MFIPRGGAEMEESTNMRLELFSFVSKCDRCGCQPRNAVNEMGRKGEEDQISKAEQFFLDRNVRINSLSYRKPMQFSQDWRNTCTFFGGFENETSRAVVNVVKFVSQ